MPTLRILQHFALALQAVSTRSPVMRWKIWRNVWVNPDWRCEMAIEAPGFRSMVLSIHPHVSRIKSKESYFISILTLTYAACCRDFPLGFLKSHFWSFRQEAAEEALLRQQEMEQRRQRHLEVLVQELPCNGRQVNEVLGGLNSRFVTCSFIGSWMLRDDIGWWVLDGMLRVVCSYVWLDFFGMTLALYGCMIKRFEKSL